MSMNSLQNRYEAGKLLAQKLSKYYHKLDSLVLSLPRGGVPVAIEVARTLKLPIDVLPIRKLHPLNHAGISFGAIASGGVQLIRDDMVQRLRISPSLVKAISLQAEYELEQCERLYRNYQTALELKEKTIILISDGIITGLSMEVALTAVKQHKPSKLVVAVPVADPNSWEAIEQQSDECICVLTPKSFIKLNRWYKNFPLVSDEQAQALLKQYQIKMA